MARLIVEWFDTEIASIEVTLRRDADGPLTVDVPRESAGEQRGIGSLADTALGDQSDPETRVSGFGLPLRGPEDHR